MVKTFNHMARGGTTNPEELGQYISFSLYATMCSLPFAVVGLIAFCVSIVFFMKASRAVRALENADQENKAV